MDPIKQFCKEATEKYQFVTESSARTFFQRYRREVGNPSVKIDKIPEYLKKIYPEADVNPDPNSEQNTDILSANLCQFEEYKSINNDLFLNFTKCDTIQEESRHNCKNQAVAKVYQDLSNFFDGFQ